MPMTKAEFDAWCVDVDAAFDDLTTKESARDALAGSVDEAQAEMDDAAAEVEAATRALDVLAQTFKQSFKDDLDVTPYVRFAGPVDGSEDVALDAPISVEFSKTMDPATITDESVYLVDEAGDPIVSPAQNALPTIDEANRVATLNLDGPLSADTVYKIKVTTAVTDADGDHMANEYEQAEGWTTVGD